MKKLLFLPLLLLASCSVTPPQPPFKVGETLRMDGTTKAGVKVSQTYPLRTEGKYEDGEWAYRFMSTGSSALEGTSALSLALGEVIVDQGGDYVISVQSSFESVAGTSNSMKTYCIAYPDSRAWRSADGFLVHDTLDKVKAFEAQLEQLTTEAAARRLLSDAGTCTLTRQ
ncbi:hypothetical protein [Deinococcus ficus]|uniref:Lipoprotein n=1 Tax=Deinococcus ficus TaxID=317577 RepID=A0A221SZ38_9DEIO|nr:hypothetical protein [Deinococcus ficus]ASN81881.1 hypothetical protein DFI_13570 [Deinococcus ficus]